MVLTIKNFSNPVGPGIIETAPTNLVGVAGVLKATLTWTSATGESGVLWTEEKLVRKEGSAPQGSMDGTVVTTITTKDTYASTGYEDTGLDSTKTYYYKAFAIYDNGTERGSTDVNVTPTRPPLIDTPGIYHDEINGLISLSGDGSNWITIADKNVGATQVYNNGDTLNSDNVGNYYYRDHGVNSPKDKWDNILSILTALGVNTGNQNCLKIYLKIPPAGFNPGGVAYNKETYLRTSTLIDSAYSYILFAYDYMLETQSFSNNYTCPVREIYTTPVQPDSSRTKQN